MRFFIMLSMILFISSCSNGQNAGQQGYEVGDVVRDFNLKGVSGEKISMKEDFPDAKGYIVTFFCNHCPYVQAYEERIIELHKDMAAKGYPLIAVNPNDPDIVPEDSYENMKKRAEKQNYPFPYVIDQTQDVAKRFGATRTPHVFLLDKQDDGKLRLAYIGTIDDNIENPGKVKKQYVREAVSAIDQGNQPPTTKTKAIGCTIKWSDQ
jgi:thiol-disulfide isomerase/thioredoxin